MYCTPPCVADWHWHGSLLVACEVWARGCEKDALWGLKPVKVVSKEAGKRQEICLIASPFWLGSAFAVIEWSWGLQEKGKKFLSLYSSYLWRLHCDWLGREMQKVRWKAQSNCDVMNAWSSLHRPKKETLTGALSIPVGPSAPDIFSLDHGSSMIRGDRTYLPHLYCACRQSLQIHKWTIRSLLVILW